MATDVLSDDMVKLVGYTVVSVKRGEERVMAGGQDTIIVTENLTDEAFISWAIGKYLQGRVEGVPRSKILSRSECQYLRVHFAVLRRWPREPLEFEERQIAALQEIGGRIG